MVKSKHFTNCVIYLVRGLQEREQDAKQNKIFFEETSVRLLFVENLIISFRFITLVFVICF